MDKYNVVLTEVCKEEKVDCIDLASMLPKETSIYYDDFHFNINGCRRVAEIVSEYLVRKAATAPAS